MKEPVDNLEAFDFEAEAGEDERLKLGLQRPFLEDIFDDLTEHFLQGNVLLRNHFLFDNVAVVIV